MDGIGDHLFEDDWTEDGVTKLKGNEPIKNEGLLFWLQKELDNVKEYKFIVSSDKQSKHNCSRHNRSEEDFSWYIEPTSSATLGGACATAPVEYILI